MGATPPVAPRSSVRRLACGTVRTVVEYGSVEKIELYHFHPFVRRGRTRPRLTTMTGLVVVVVVVVSMVAARVTAAMSTQATRATGPAARGPPRSHHTSTAAARSTAVTSPTLTSRRR